MSFSTMELLLGVLSLGLTAYLLITKSAFFRGRQSVRQEIDDDNAKLILALDKTVNSLTSELNYLLPSHKNLSEKVNAMEKQILLQEAKLIQLDKVFDRIIAQNNEIQVNLNENSKAILSLSSSMEAIHQLLDNVIKGNLIIRKNDG